MRIFSDLNEIKSAVGTEIPDGLHVNDHLVIEIEDGKKPACVAESIALHCR
ncbi:hypothetical protein [Bradyrhizobium sp. CCGUVB14]|uniref:hypothetical protein n=1 Tax=Bradyrhizobium sp. CCGUVB14 TaxID=2949628 RepID=UPI0020B27B62|nr:hypothetical protein [Bradyrhizobium sp. CCGUVB14]MCP3444272.1 hypothetical protein [Bradyrhizobium sp. CCGUVB14]